MENEDFRIIIKNNTTIKCFRDGRIFTLFITNEKREKWIERSNKPNKKGYIRIKFGGKIICS
jgi:hypothetical protein